MVPRDGGDATDFATRTTEAMKSVNGGARTELQVIEGAGHYPHVSHAQKVAGIIDSFLSS